MLSAVLPLTIRAARSACLFFAWINRTRCALDNVVVRICFNDGRGFHNTSIILQNRFVVNDFLHFGFF